MLKVGDIVRIKTWEEMLEDENVHLEGDSLRNINDDSYFVQEMKQYCGKVITINENNLVKYSDSIIYYDTWEFFDWIYTIIGHINELNQSCIIKNKTKVVVEQGETGQKLLLFPNKTPILSDGNIVENKIGNRGVYINKRIRYPYGSSDTLDYIIKVYKIKDDCGYGYLEILESSSLDDYCDVIWENPSIEQSLDNLDVGTILTVKFKENGKIKECTVGNIGDKRILIYDCSMACLFDTNKHEILEIKEYAINDLLKSTKIEQSLDGLEIGTKVKVINKLLDITETLTVGRFNSKKVLIRDGLTCYKFNPDKYEILEIIK